MATKLASDGARAAFLDETRLGILISSKADGSPLGVPVWFEWTGEEVKMFSPKDSQKISRFRSNAVASLLVTNRVGGPEAWIAFDGKVEISDFGAIELAEKLAARYWDMTDPARVVELASWHEHADAFCLLGLYMVCSFYHYNECHRH